MTPLERLARRVLSCRECPGLNEPGVTEAAPAYGNPTSKILFVGQSCHAFNPETPDRQIPFLNSSKRPHAGTILFPALEAAGLKFEDVCTTNVVKCHPPRNRRTTAEENAACLRWLLKEVALVRPRMVVCLGNAAGEALNVPTKYRVTQSQLVLADGEVFKFYATLMPHPAWLLRLQGDDDQERAEAEHTKFVEYLKWIVREFNMKAVT